MTFQQLLSPVRRAVDEYKMIKKGDKVAVGLSGGKDSLTLLSALAGLRRFYPKKFDLVAVTVDMGLDYDKQEVENIKNFCKSLNVEYYIEKTQIAEVVFEARKEKSPCRKGGTSQKRNRAQASRRAQTPQRTRPARGAVSENARSYRRSNCAGRNHACAGFCPDGIPLFGRGANPLARGILRTRLYRFNRLG